jgi:predicted nucleic acid-binding protein
MAILIDTCVLIEAERGRLKPAEIWLRPGEDFCISAVTASELLHGVFRATDDSIRASRLFFAESIFEWLPVVPIDLVVAREHARIWSYLKAAGLPIEAHDLWSRPRARHITMRCLPTTIGTSDGYRN